MSMWNPNSFEDVMRRDAFENFVIESGGTVISILYRLALVAIVAIPVLGILNALGVHVTVGN